MAEKRIDPSKARIDLDALSLMSWKTDIAVLDKDSFNRDTADSQLTLMLTGGLGRVTTTEGNYFVDPVGKVKVTGTMYGIPMDAHLGLTTMLDRWVAVGVPLRLLEFTDHTMLMEDGSNFMVLPPADIKISAAQAPH